MAFKSAPETLFEDDQQLWPSNLLLKTSLKMISSYGPSNLLLKTFEDDQQLWSSNLLLQTSLKMINSYGLQICC
jgi:hypothetical protein